MIYKACGATFTISGVIDFRIFTLVCVSSILVWPGLRAIPEVIITMSESFASSYSPAMIEIGSLKQVPCAISMTSPSTFSLLMSIRTISDATFWLDKVYAIVEPTLPAPITVILLLIVSPSSFLFVYFLTIVAKKYEIFAFYQLAFLDFLIKI